MEIAKVGGENVSFKLKLNKLSFSKLSKYSYQDCWNYTFSLDKNLVIEEVKKDIIILCQTTPEKFWHFFSTPFLTPPRYFKICYNLKRYFQQNYPLPYLVKQVYFNRLPFYIEKGVFIPQPDTEILLRKTCQLINQQWGKSANLKILDLGTGCGNLAISLAKVYPASQITALDVSSRALKVVRKNVLWHQIKNLVVKQSNLFSQLNLQERFNVIIVNPPYVSRQEYENLSLITKKQPCRALVAKQKGYFFYQAILSQASSFLTPPSLILFEIGYQQKEKILELILRYFPKTRVSVFSDERGHSRVITIESSPKVF